MKTTMKLFAALTIMLGFSIATIGQNTSANAGTTANANVVAALAVDALQSLDFGNLLATGSKSVNLAGTPSGSVIGGGEHQGKFSITKGLNTTVDLNFTALPTQLDLASAPTSTVKLPVTTYTASWTENATSGLLGTATQWTPVQGTAQLTCGGTSNAVFYVHLGGTVTPNGTTTSGAYVGTITLVATYN